MKKIILLFSIFIVLFSFNVFALTYNIIYNKQLAQQVEVDKDVNYVANYMSKFVPQGPTFILPAKTRNINVTTVLYKRGTGFYYVLPTRLIVITQNESDTAVTINGSTYITNFTVFYDMPGPSKEEQIILENDEKQITVSSPYSYTNVLAKTVLSNPLPIELVDLSHITGTGREPANVTNYIDTNGDGYIDEIEWIVPHLSAETYDVGLKTSFATGRLDHPELPSGWYIQQGGENQVDDDCVYTGSWKITTDTYTGKQGVMYIPILDQELGCGLRLPPFITAKTGYATLSFIFKENFTEKKVQYPSEMVVVNYGYDTCNIYFNNEDISGHECTPIVTDLGNGWKKITVTDWKITSTSEPIILYTSAHRRLINDYGIIILDDIRVVLP